MRSLLVRPWRAAPAGRLYVALRGANAFGFALFATLYLVFQVRVVGLDPFQMVLVGTALEVTIVLFEVPTGVVADLHSRRLSAIIGFALMGVGVLVEATFASYPAALANAVVWGVGYTFVSGALEAWITDEVGEDAVRPLFTRGTQAELAGTVVGTLAAGGLGLLGLRVPLFVGGAVMLVVVVALLLAMPEEHFHPTPRDERETFAHLRRQLVAALHLARRRRVVRGFLAVSLLVGLSAEVVDRLWTVRLLQDFDVPDLLGGGEVVTFTAIALVGESLALLGSLAGSRWLPAHVADESPARPVGAALAVHVVALVAIALGGSLLLVLGALWLRTAARAFAAPIERAWLNRSLEPGTRATVLSIEGQVNAVGEVAGGPPLGAVAGRFGIPVAFLVSAAILAPSVGIVAAMRGGDRLPASKPDRASA